MNNTKNEIAKLQMELERKSGSLLLLVLLIVVAVALWIEIPIWVLDFFEIDHSKLSAGEVGDVFGSVNALFAGLAFVCLIWTIRQTNLEMRLQQRVAVLQVIELESSTSAMEEQASEQKKMTDAQTKLTDAQKQMANAVADLVGAVGKTNQQSSQFATQIHGHSQSLYSLIGRLETAFQASAISNVNSTLARLYWDMHLHDMQTSSRAAEEARGKFEEAIKLLENYNKNMRKIMGG